MPLDSFKDTPDTLISSARDCFSIAPSNTNEVYKVTKALYIGGSGNITLRTVGSVADVVFANVPSGAILDVRAEFVRATGTTATDIVGLA